jgi:uncharacterized protein
MYRPFFIRGIMFRFAGLWFIALALSAGVAANAQTLVIVPAHGEIKAPNDEARAVFMIEEQDRDKAAAASRVNQKMKQGAEIIKREDPQAVLKTRGYFTYPVYPENTPRQAGKPGQPASWRVGQYLDVATTNLGGLPKTVAAGQRVLALNGLSFGLSEPAARKLDGKLIEVAYRNLTERIASIARAMGRRTEDAVLDTVDFEGSGAYAQQQESASPKMMRAGVAAEAQVEEPSFEPGETALNMRIVAKVKFK